MRKCEQCIYYPHCDEYPFDESGCDDYKDRSKFVEVRHGRWKGAGMGDHLCSICREVYSGGDKFNYCPNCGAKMKEVV